MSVKRWTPEEIATLRKMYLTNAAPACARAMGRTVDEIYSAVARYDCKKSETVSIPDNIRALCRIDGGMTCAEIARRMARDYDNISTAIRRMVSAGTLFKTGKGKNFRYFSDAEKAAEAMAIADELHKQQREAARLKKQAARNEKRRAERERFAAKNAAVVKKKAEKQQFLIERKHVPLDKIDAKPENVIWPDHVKVQVIPHGVDNRFTFEPPKYWRGDLVREFRELTGANR